MKNIKPFGPSIGKTKISKKFSDKLNNEFDSKSISKKIDYSSKLASQIKNELKISNNFIKKNLEKELKESINKFLSNEKIQNIKEIKILNFWIVRQFKGEYNPIHYHEGDLSGVGYLKLPKGMTNNKMVKNKKLKTNGTIDFINGQKGFLSKSIYNVVPKIRDLLIFPNYLMHTAYPFNIEGERRSFSFNAKIFYKK
ncbi:2OG-Fe(II) oxygenase family protein [Candidatus Pelagibacter sp.]|nr:2OG-Fe(II) oxygenase family protein [Candidatus Pelagibacter sp.]MDC0465618.1 2OG-Fe(II) oxygenase family protein [Candidatus Pelagibacter sp.]